AVTDFQLDVALDFVAFYQRDADDEHGHTEVRELHTPVRAALAGEPGPESALEVPHAFPDAEGGRSNDPEGEEESERDQRCPAAREERHDHRGHDAHAQRPAQ